MVFLIRAILENMICLSNYFSVSSHYRHFIVLSAVSANEEDHLEW